MLAQYKSQRKGSPVAERLRVASYRTKLLLLLGYYY